MNTITVQLNDKQYDAMMGLLDYAQSDLQSDLRNASDEESEAEAKEMLVEHEDLVQELTSTKSYLWTDSHGYIELEIDAEHVDSICHSGDNLLAVKGAIASDGYLNKQLEDISLEDAQSFISEALGDDTKGVNRKEFILWTACWDLFDGKNQETD